MREERGADPRPACSADRTGGRLDAVVVTHRRDLCKHGIGALSGTVITALQTSARGRTSHDTTLVIPVRNGKRVSARASPRTSHSPRARPVPSLAAGQPTSLLLAELSG